ncbi:hypothetical protein FACS1894164_05360 [Spirochaetia bacterium]|nr:hypothetical protein FACS1894164_05360 [Spirochaetia bacterium]
MKSKLFFVGLLAMVLAFGMCGLVFAEGGVDTGSSASMGREIAREYLGRTANREAAYLVVKAKQISNTSMELFCSVVGGTGTEVAEIGRQIISVVNGEVRESSVSSAVSSIVTTALNKVVEPAITTISPLEAKIFDALCLMYTISK